MREWKRMWHIFYEASKEAHREFWAPVMAFWRESTTMAGPGTYSLHVHLSEEANAVLEKAVHRTGKQQREVIEELLLQRRR